MGKRINVDWGGGGLVVLDAHGSLTPYNPPPRNEVFDIDDVSDRARVSVPAGTEGLVVYTIKFSYFIGSSGFWGSIKKGVASFDLQLDYKCEPDGTLAVTRRRSGVRAWSSPISMSLSPEFHPAAGKVGPNLTVDVGLAYPEDADGQLTVGGTVGGVGGTYTTGAAAGKTSGLEWGTRLDFTVTGAKATPPPKPPTPVPLPPLRGWDTTVYFEHEGQDDLDKNAPGKGNTVTDLQNWATKLQRSGELYEAITRRYVPVHLWGYASITDGDAKNFDLSGSRIQNVQKRLVGMLGTPFGKEVVFDRRQIGKREANPKLVPPAERDAVYLKDRRVEVAINEPEAAEGIRRMRQGLPAM